MHMHSLILKGLLILFPAIVAAQQPESYFREKEDSLRNLAYEILANPFEADKIKADETLKSLLLNTLKQEGSALYPFDSLKYISVLQSNDNRVRIFSWYHTRDDKKHYYSAIVQVMTSNKLFGFLPFEKKRKTERVTLLIDDSDNIENPERQNLNAGNWYGALYYDIISPGKSKGKYVLLGWDGDSDLLNRKIIEVLSVTGRGDPQFRSSLFRYENKPVKRILFEYAESAVMSLRYNEQEKMIVFDHLEPSHPQLKGNRAYYGPDFSYEGFQFKKGRWEYIPHVIPKNENDKKKFNNPE